MNDFHVRTWAPIEDLPTDWDVSLRNAQTEALVDAWLEQAEELREQGFYIDFLAKLKRQWSIETGVIEGLYDLSDGATKTLIEKGLDASLISHTEASDEPTSIVEKILDHHRAIDGLYDFVSGNRPLGTSYVKELHQVLTEHQLTYLARDTLGNRVVRDLPRGEWKWMKNNVEHGDGSVFEYCPPEHVAQEMDNLISLHSRHVKDGVPADVESAWLHHRFAIIHPFTDGNGRVARCLATLVLLREHWLPLVVTRMDRSKYINALRAADNGDLKLLVDFVGSLQRKAIREAFSLSDQVISESRAVSGILAAVKAKFAERREADEDLRKNALTIADSLFVFAKESLRTRAVEIRTAIQDEGIGFIAFEAEGANNSDRSRFYYHQIVESAKSFEYFANLDVYHAWTSLVINTTRRAEILFSFHGIGQKSSGVLGCAAMFFTKEKNEDGETEISGFVPLGDEPFEFTYTENDGDVRNRFQKWLDQIVLLGLEEWQKVV